MTFPEKLKAALERESAAIDAWSSASSSGRYHPEDEKWEAVCHELAESRFATYNLLRNAAPELIALLEAATMVVHGNGITFPKHTYAFKGIQVCPFCAALDDLNAKVQA